MPSPYANARIGGWARPLANGLEHIYVFGAYTTETYRTTYSKQLMPISIQDLTPDLEVKPPIQVKQRGRPKTKRIRKGQYARKKRRCGNCSQLATHNSRSCRAQPCDIEGLDLAVNALQNQRQRMRTRRQNQDFDREMDRLDGEIESLQAENEGLPASAYTLPTEHEDSYESPSDIEFSDGLGSMGGLDSGSRGSSPLSVLSGYSEPTELAIEPASELSIGSVIIVDSRPQGGRRERV
jgi:hypothetical protein